MFRFFSCWLCPAVREDVPVMRDNSLVLHVLSMQQGWLSEEDRLLLLFHRLVSTDPESSSLIPRNSTVDAVGRDFVHAHLYDFRGVVKALDFLNLRKFSVTRDIIDWKLIAIKKRLPEYLENAHHPMHRYLPRITRSEYGNFFSDAIFVRKNIGYAKNKFRDRYPNNRILAVINPNSLRVCGEIALVNFSVQSVVASNGDQYYVDFHRAKVALLSTKMAFMASSTARAIVYINRENELCLIRREDSAPVVLLKLAGIKLFSFTSSPGLDFIYIVYTAGNLFFAFICPAEAGDCRVIPLGDSLVEIDGDFAYSTDAAGMTTFVTLREQKPLHRTRFPDIWHAHDLKQMAVGNALVFYEYSKSRLITLFTFICFFHAGRIKSVDAGELRNICDARDGSKARWEAISRFLWHKPYSTGSVMIRINEILGLSHQLCFEKNVFFG